MQIMLFSSGMTHNTILDSKITSRKTLKWLLPTYIRIVNPIVASTTWENGFKENKKGASVRKPLYNIPSGGYVVRLNIITFVND
jgi:hypothetical protein